MCLTSVIGTSVGLTVKFPALLLSAAMLLAIYEYRESQLMSLDFFKPIDFVTKVDPSSS